jgi:uncharacterized DUF497 family protein
VSRHGDFEWDEANIGHIGRHDVTPAEVEQALENDPTDVAYEVVDGEERWTSIAHTREFRVLLVVWTLRRDAVRVVTDRVVSKSVGLSYLRKREFPV